MLAGILLLIFLLAEGYTRHAVKNLPDQNEAVRWSEDGDAAQISVFLTQDESFTTESVRQVRYNIDNALRDASVTRDLSKPSSRLYADCYSALGVMTVNTDTKSVKTTTIGVGGDFFLFHPLTLVEGSYFSGSDLMQDLVIVDEDLAWQLFGSNNIVGKTVTLGDVPHTIVGVAKKEKGKLLEASGGTGSILYTSFDSLVQYGTVTGAGVFGGTSAVGKYENAGEGTGSYADVGWASSVSGKTPMSGINCYEIVMPNIVRHFALNLVKEKAGFQEERSEFIENSARFSPESLFRILTGSYKRSMRLNAIHYPYWENEARGWEDILARVFLIRVLCLLLLVLLVVFVIVQAYRHKKWTAGSIARTLADKKYDWEVKRREKRVEKVREARADKRSRVQADLLRKRKKAQTDTQDASTVTDGIRIVEWE
ncbi:MAG: ABC transporter permease [Lachnospiraceae bacterium]|nr:ABC transporter permease [Lachnospiraceae bacterium]